MANELKEINDIVKKCKILLLDIEGTTTSISFVKDKLFPYAEENVKQFLESQWENEDVKEVVVALRKLALEDKEKSVDGAVVIPGENASKEEQIEGLVNSVKWQMSADRKVGPLKQLQGLIWKQGYDKGDIKGHVYDDVMAALEQWKSVDGQKVYIYSSGSIQAQKLLFGQSQAGDLLQFIEGHFDTAVGAKQDATSYKAIVESIGCKPDEILFLTDIVKEAEAARSAGLHAALVSREGNAPLPEDATAAYAVLHSLAQLAASNKRKTEPQDELPAKIAKTDNEEDIKTLPKEKTDESKEAKVIETVEKMEVEEQATEEVKEQNEEKKEVESSSTIIETIIEEVADSKEPVDVPIADLEPIIEDNIEKNTEKMETDLTENEESVPVIKEVDENKTENVKENATKETAPVAEETPHPIITEIEEITNENVLEVEEMIEDIEPVVEEPASEDMEVLQSAGEVLEKECDEILSKVQDVTNLDTIPVKPLLNPIAEETLEAENLDSNDIVDRILDTELELEMKQNENITNKSTETLTELSVVKKADTVEEKETVCKEDSLQESENLPKDISEEKTDESNNDTKTEKVKDIAISNTNTESKKEETHKSESKITETLVQMPEKSPDSEEKVSVESKVTIEEDKSGTETTESQVNGKATNGETESVSLNGDVSKDEELSSRLSAENGKQEEVNGSNGDSVDTVKSQDEKKTDTEVSDIKVKTVPTEEPHTDPIEQPTEA